MTTCSVPGSLISRRTMAPSSRSRATSPSGVGTGVQIKVQSVLDRLGLGHLLEQQPPAQSDPGAFLNRIVWMPHGLERPECGSVIHGHHHVLRDRASAQQPFDEHAVVLHHVAERGGPEGGLGMRIRAVDDDLPVECHVPSMPVRGSGDHLDSRLVPPDDGRTAHGGEELKAGVARLRWTAKLRDGKLSNLRGPFVARVENRHRAGSRTEETTVKPQLAIIHTTVAVALLPMARPAPGTAPRQLTPSPLGRPAARITTAGLPAGQVRRNS